MKTKTQHTPGPWIAKEDPGCRNILANDGHYEFRICCTDGLADDDEDSANARLIAAAPELLEALRECLAIVYLQNGNLHDDINEIIERATAAIRKAEGE